MTPRSASLATTPGAMGAGIVMSYTLTKFPLRIVIEPGMKGLLYAHSPDEPGLLVAAHSLAEVLSAVAPALDALVEAVPIVPK